MKLIFRIFLNITRVRIINNLNKQALITHFFPNVLLLQQSWEGFKKGTVGSSQSKTGLK